MSRRADRAEVVIICGACGRGQVGSFHLDDDGDLELTSKPETLASARFSCVRDLARPDERPGMPEVVTLFCREDHELRLRLAPILDDLKANPGRRLRRVV